MCYVDIYESRYCRIQNVNSVNISVYKARTAYTHLFHLTDLLMDTCNKFSITI